MARSIKAFVSSTAKTVNGYSHPDSLICMPTATCPCCTRLITPQRYGIQSEETALNADIEKITQGCTTEVIGQDGISYSPVSDLTLSRIRKQIAGWNSNPQDPPDFFDRWRTVKEYLDVLDREEIATNAAYLVPQGNLRMLVKGWDSSPCSQEEIETMKDILKTSLEEGAVGMSSGLTYVPGMFADNDELTQLCEVVRDHGGYYCPQ